MINRDSKKWKSDKCNTFAYGFSVFRFILFSNIPVNIYYSYIYNNVLKNTIQKIQTY